MDHTLLGLIYFVAFSHGLMLAVSLWRKSEPKSSGRWLAIIAFVITYKLFEGGALYSGFYQYVSHMMDLLPGEVLYIGPLIYTYIQHVSGKANPPVHIRLLHFIPAAALWIYNTPSVFRSEESKINMWDFVLSNTSEGLLPWQYIVLFLTIKTHLGLYLYFSWRAIKQFEVASLNLRADNSNQLLVGMKFMVIAFFLLECVWVSLFAGQQFFSLGTLSSVSDIWLLLVASMVLGIGYVGLQNPNLVFSKEEQKLVLQQPALTTPQTTEETVKYLHSALPESTGELLAKELEEQISSKQLYLNEKLTLTELAKATDIKAHTVSQVINQTMKTNFYRLINGYRIQHAAELIDDDKLNWTLERIAYESGFTNRVTFSNAFKEVMACTPSNYKKQQREKVG